jgi:hypothetical protein
VAADTWHLHHNSHVSGVFVGDGCAQCDEAERAELDALPRRRTEPATSRAPPVMVRAPVQQQHLAEQKRNGR